MYNHTILILYTELMPYNVIVIKELVRRGCCVHVVLRDENKQTPYFPPQVESVTYYNRSTFWNSDHLFRLVKKLDPELVWTAGWIDPLYNKVSHMIRKKLHIPVVAGSDTQWRGGKQWLNVLFARFRQHRWFSHIFVSGEWQEVYARKLGFTPEQILMHNLSADTGLFNRVNIDDRKKNYPKRLLYIGRYSPEKGLLYLLKAWESISDRKGWRLTLVGNGPEREKLAGYPEVEILDFMEQEELLRIMQESGAFILPSVSEQWSLAIHEAACTGLPILASECCGAVTCFLKEGKNGFKFIPGNIASIRTSIEALLRLPESDLIEMGKTSRELSRIITPSKVADTLLQLL